MNKFTFLKAFWSPFKRPKVKLYIGKVALGTPIFYPRRLVKLTKDEVKAKVREKVKKYMENSDEYITASMCGKIIESTENSRKFIPKKIGFDFVGLGWKSKWSDTDYRFEWAPIWSFVFFKWQIAITFEVPSLDHYWEAWLFYERNTDKSKRTKDRIAKCKDKFPLKYTNHHANGTVETIDYYDLILKNG